MSFRADGEDAAAVDQWSRRLHIDRPELLREALRRHVAELTANRDVHAPPGSP